MTLPAQLDSRRHLRAQAGFVCPVDGAVIQCGKIVVQQAKSLRYSAQALSAFAC
jgi:phosphatidylserine decarboxylase